MEESVGNTDNFADSGCVRRVLKGKLQANDAVTSIPSLRTNFQSLRLVIWRSHYMLILTECNLCSQRTPQPPRFRHPSPTPQRHGYEGVYECISLGSSFLDCCPKERML
ncbi:hypothetical protein M378DRAFT_857917 [Amanita muscaria Koide BX008]|uniref:Uncharacterized protein n=1 Tax=Amanita muscaria (strain Koide BX008) TaxID=946122 RepID=A0A0C2SE81_AMAMK|nr:hypothetical protein M378DRAFT_857917 [Amanita muscaria Koide BX008]